MAEPDRKWTAHVKLPTNTGSASEETMSDDKKDNVIHLPTDANLKHAFEQGKLQGEVQAKAILDNPPTPQQLLLLCCEAAKYDMKPQARKFLHKALVLLSSHFAGGDPSEYYSDPKKIVGCAFVLGVHTQMNKRPGDEVKL